MIIKTVRNQCIDVVRRLHQFPSAFLVHYIILISIMSSILSKNMHDGLSAVKNGCINFTAIGFTLAKKCSEKTSAIVQSIDNSIPSMQKYIIEFDVLVDKWGFSDSIPEFQFTLENGQDLDKDDLLTLHSDLFKTIKNGSNNIMKWVQTNGGKQEIRRMKIIAKEMFKTIERCMYHVRELTYPNTTTAITDYEKFKQSKSFVYEVLVVNHKNLVDAMFEPLCET